MLNATDIINAAIMSAFLKYPRDDDPDWGHNWIDAEDGAHLTKVVLLELEANGFEIVKKRCDQSATGSA
jgi:hypothetical protein